MIEWQPIETADKSNKRILLWESSYGIAVGYWDGGVWKAVSCDYEYLEDSAMDGSWFRLSPPTHWMKIEPPKEAL